MAFHQNCEYKKKIIIFKYIVMKFLVKNIFYVRSRVIYFVLYPLTCTLNM